MAKFRVISTAVYGGVLVGRLKGKVDDDHAIQIRLTWTQEHGVIGYELSGNAGDLRWALSPQLAIVAAEAVVKFAAEKTGRVDFEWSPEIEWGLRHLIGRDAAPVKPMLYASEEDALDEFKRVQAYDLYARIAAGPWGLIKKAGEGDD